MSGTSPTKSLMIIDDDPHASVLAERALEGSRLQVSKYADMESAWRAATTSAPHLILLDLKIGNLDGFTFLQKRKSDPLLASIPIIVVSASRDLASVRKAMSLGAIDYITKPYRPELLRLKVHRGLHERTFGSYTFDRNSRPEIRASFSVRIIGILDSGLEIVGKVRLGACEDVRLRAPLLEALHLEKTPLRTSPHAPFFFMKNREHISEIIMMGTSSSLKELFRKWKKGRAS